MRRFWTVDIIITLVRIRQSQKLLLTLQPVKKDTMRHSPAKVDRLFETSWEVCNKVGGIYTVLSTKALTLQRLYKDKVIFIGPDVWSDENPSPYFVESARLLRPWRRGGHLPEGVSVRVGRWNIPGNPVAILVRFDGMYAVKNEVYGEMWRHFGVDSLHAYGDYDESCCFALAAAAVISSICEFYTLEGKNVIAHFDEWTTGMGLLWTKLHVPYVSTVFTTHATCIGRSICGNGKPLYSYLRGYNGDQMAQELNMQSKHSLEKAAAHNADSFTTVSEVTAAECGQLLEKLPDIVTPNGFENDFVPAGADFVVRRRAARARLLDIAEALTGHSFGDSTFIVATSGRCEYRNKGIDMYLDAVDRIRRDARVAGRDILALVLVPAWARGPRPDLSAAIANHADGPLAEPVITHWLNNPDSDPILGRIRQIGFNVNRDAHTLCIYVPCYLSGQDGIVGLSYYDTLIGLDATVFPSYYEPWGYTPLESIAFGVPTVTTSLSGFGQWILSNFGNGFGACGVRVVNRDDDNYNEATDSIVSALAELVNDDAGTRAAVSGAAVKASGQAAWSHFIRYYTEAYATALDNGYRRMSENKGK